MRLEPSFLVARNLLPLNVFWHPIVKGGYHGENLQAKDL